LRRREGAEKRRRSFSLDPLIRRCNAKLTKKAGRENTFRAVANEVIAKQEREGRAQRTINKKRWLLDFALPRFGDRPVVEITARDLLALLREIEGRGLYETAQRLRSTCGMVLRYAIATGRAERDPSMDLRGVLTAPQVNHRATIIDHFLEKLKDPLDYIKNSILANVSFWSALLGLAYLIYKRLNEQLLDLSKQCWRNFILVVEKPEAEAQDLI
jgi:integrase